jgi:hypothetical protein
MLDRDADDLLDLIERALDDSPLDNGMESCRREEKEG